MRNRVWTLTSCAIPVSYFWLMVELPIFTMYNTKKRKSNLAIIIKS